jgi:hypothetical protein
VKSTLKASAVVAGIVLFAATLLAADGILIVEKTTKGGTTVTNMVQIEKTRMRAESVSASGGKQVVVFDGAAQVMRMIDVDKKTYSEMTKEDIDQLGGQMTAAMAKMEEQLKKMSPEQRAQMEAMMKGRGGAMGAPTAPKTEYRKAGTDTVGKWTCDKYEGFQNNQKVSEVCTVDPKALGYSLTDFDVTRQMGAFFQKLMPQNADQMFAIGSADAQGFSGVPVRRITSFGPQQTVVELSEVSRQTFADSLFAVPEGFQKQQGSGRGRVR